ncbi:uncharacterized protein LOC111640270 isoform X3 [Centruroides sculpturatus]|uniref:uncharacterized protein LOC111640270 isoform X2 n=1 Tax=Centruroides sculpturatus TaxID=218467 RepID=UPI000C6D6576|nr:uncharacterized protein LOC111640270 isoform X2 [Centruroides sculpturatus]XP_023242043.1 uncharacterized protein LOC111640270 isoform X3 [Centruroides sculpturatus]
MDSIEKLPSTSVPVVTKEFIVKSTDDNSSKLSTVVETESFIQESDLTDTTVPLLQVNDPSVQNTILDHSYPIMTLSKKIAKMDEDLSVDSQAEQETENPINAENSSDITQVEILSEKDNQNDETNKAERNQSVTDAEVMLLMKQQQQLIKQQGQMLQVLQELKDIQKEILGLKRKNHELKLTKLRIAAQQAGIKVITKANK